jgi:hypothetical protein
MKRIIVIAIIVVSSICTVKSQGLIVTTSGKQLIELKEKGVSVVIPNNKFGEELKSAVEKHWNATKFQFVSEEEVAKFENNKEIALLGFFKGDFDATGYSLSNIDFIGITKKYKENQGYKVSDSRGTYAGFIYPGEGVVESDLESTLVLYIKTLNYMINSGGAKKWMAEMKKAGSSDNKKIIYALEKDLEIPLEELKTLYKGDIEVVEKSIYNKAILDNKDVLFFVNTKTSACFNFSVISNTGFPHYALIGGQVSPRMLTGYLKMLFKKL